MTRKIIKVRDLTDKEAQYLCNKHFKKFRTCFGCQLRIENSVCYKLLDLDRAIEVEYDESK